MNFRIKILISLLVFVLGAGGSFFITREYMLKQQKNLLNQIRPIRNTNSKYHFTNPLLGYYIPNNKELGEYKPLEDKIKDYIFSQTQQQNVDKISVYFRDLNKGRWTGVNEDEKYDPASMLKVVIMMAYYKQAETDPEILGQKIVYTKALDESIDQLPFQTASNLTTGESYSIESLIEAMIIHSDNGAKNALLAKLDDNSLNEVYSDLGINAPREDKEYIISAKSYSMFFRTLYNSTYLSDTYSEKALELLTKANYSEGLVAGVPKNIQVAQKFGERVISDKDNTASLFELHDCGITYYPDKPYILCVMTEGKNLNNLTSAIKNISNLVYQNINKN